MNYFVSTLGNDLDAGAINNPWKTLSKAMDMVQPGDTAYIKDDGIYDTEDGSSGAVMQIKTVGELGKPIRFKGWLDDPEDTGHRFKIRGGANLDGVKEVATRPEKSFIIFEGIDVADCTGTNAFGFRLPNSKSMIIRDFIVSNITSRGIQTDTFCTVLDGVAFNCGTGVVMDARSTAIGVHSYNNNEEGILVGGQCMIKHCRCENNGTDQFAAWAHGQGSYFDDCVANGNGATGDKAGFYIADAYYGTVINSLILDNPIGVKWTGGENGSNIIVNSNTYSGNGLDLSTGLVDRDMRSTGGSWLDWRTGE